jgi:hypothetical protein
MPVDVRSLDVQFRGEEANTIFIEPIYMDDDLRSQFRIIPNVTSKKKLAFVQELEKIVRSHTGCGFSPVGSTRVYERWIEVDKAKADVAMCWEEFKDTVYEELLKKGLSMGDLTGTLLMQISEAMVKNAIKKDNQRLAWFGDKADDDPAYDCVDGFWRVILKAFVDADQCPYFDTGSGTALSAGDGIEMLRTLYSNQDVRLRGLPDETKKFWVSGTIWEQYQTDLEDGGGADGGWQMLQSGKKMLTFRNIEVKPMWLWSEIMAQDFSQDNAHLALLTTPQNLAMGTDFQDAESQLRMWYDEEDEMVKTKARWKHGFQVVHPQLLSVGY